MQYEARTEKQTFWAAILQEAESSDLSLAEYARTNNIRVQTMYQWRSTLKGNAKPTDTVTPHQFTQAIVAAPNSLSVEISNARLRFNGLPDPLWLSAFLNGSIPS